jgi:hypothetical protein
MFLGVVPAPAQAQQQSELPTDALVGFVGRNFGGHLFDGTTGLDSSNNPRAYGASILFWGPGVIAAELDYGYNPEFFGPKDDVSENNLISITMSAIVGPTIPLTDTMRLRPYFVIGGGLIRSKISEFADLGLKDTNNRGVVDVGGGLYYYFLSHLGVRGDIRYFRGVGANDTDNGWGFLDHWDYYRGTIGLAIAF